MREIGAYEAKTHLPKLLERVEKGERFVITRHGRAVAELVPVGRRDPKKIRKAIEGLKAFQETHSLGGLFVRKMIMMGRRCRTPVPLKLSEGLIFYREHFIKVCYPNPSYLTKVRTTITYQYAQD